MSNIIPVKAQEWTPEQLKLITETVAKGATKDELQLFLYRCKNIGLDPLKPGQIHFVKYGTGSGTIVIGIEGFRAIAGRTGKLSGIKRGVLKDAQGRLTGGWAEVYRVDWKECAREETPIHEYNTGKGPWAKMPETMIKKVAEAAALRMAFPESLGGIYEAAEMDQAEAHQERYKWSMKANQPELGDGIPDDAYRVPFGKFAKRMLEEIDFNDLRNYIKYLEDKEAKEQKPLSPVVLDFIKRAESHIAAFENNPLEA